MKTNSNTYTIIYAAVMVVIVAFLLAFVSSALKSKQDQNVELDTKKQILYSLNVRDINDANAQYNQYIKKDPADHEIEDNYKGRRTIYIDHISERIFDSHDVYKYTTYCCLIYQKHSDCGILNERRG